MEMSAGEGSNASGPRKRRDFQAIARAALVAVDTVLLRWLPGGQRRGAEYVATNPRRNDARAGSFSVNTVKGAWSDFATGDKGGDLVALVAYLEGCSQADAADHLAAMLGVSNGAMVAPLQASKPAPAQAKPVTPIPDDAPRAPTHHARHGEPSQIWRYCDAKGRELYRVARFDGADGKQVLPLSLWRETDALRWCWKALPAPRPLYGLERLAAAPAAPVLVTEGEKDCDAARALVPAWVAITSPNGSKSAAKAEWSALRGRRVLVWPDADEAGAGYAHDVARLALAAGALSVSVLRLESFATLRGSALPEGWGAADALAEGITGDALAGVMGDPTNATAQQPARAAARASSRLPDAGGPPRPRFVHMDADAQGRRAGVYWLPVATDKATGEAVEGEPQWICSPLHIEAVTRDDAGADWGRLLVFPDRDSSEHRWAMPMAMLGRDGAELRETLLAMGLEITPDANRRRRLLEFIQAVEPEHTARCCARAGWHGSAFVLPTITIGGAGDEALVFQSAAPGDSKLAEAGTLADWQASVCAPSAGNSRLVLALSAAFAAPCLHLAGLEGGGLHLRAGSTCGKSTALAIAASVYGPPGYMRQWRSTDNALEGVAAMHCDALLPLDEIGQLDPKHAASVAYLLSNGQGKLRSKRDGSLRAPATWRLLFLSTGEVGLGDLIVEAGGKHRAGMEVRMIELQADACTRFGLFERLPPELIAAELSDKDRAGAFSDMLRDAAAANHGTAFPAFLRSLVGDLERARRFLRDGMDALTAELAAGDAAGQVRRVARRFALIAAAGEWATAHGITGWPQGEAERAIKACFMAWCSARGGTGESEPREMVRAVQAFIGLHSEGRFAAMARADDDRAPRTLQRAGWRVDSSDGVEHWVLPEVFRREVCAGFDYREVAQVLVQRGLLRPSESNCFTRSERIRGSGESARVYRLLPGVLECEP
ncbi:MAG: hypothetical protein CVV12_04890 [Gammaproteobacteria bacterium HGW-Gammaproteobacteria-2]|jgi:uncharacterized protein (DUF927 family)|nr:MAG: hypothetical protein CVV12_04890 [Gammaproteobacteria bacterium HGW-Gammaproteobacteria-2]